jgi:hypothetical protein
MQGNASAGYCSVNDVRFMTNLATSDISDGDLYELIKMAAYQINSEIATEVVREKVLWLDDTRKNDINGTNTTYYVANWKGKYIADYDNDGDVDISDITVYAVYSDGTETEATVSSITPDSGKFVLSSAYSSSYSLYVTYKWSYVSTYDPDKLVKLSCIYLAAAYAYAKINVGKAPTAAFGNLKIYRDMNSFDKYYKRYQEIINTINDKMLTYGESEVI